MQDNPRQRDFDRANSSVIMSDADDDLLALAGAGAASEEEQELSQRDEEFSGLESEQEVPINPYPLEGKYKDEDDKQRLIAMPEVERESILFDRAQEVQRFEEQQYLSQRAKQRLRETTESTRARSKRNREIGSSARTDKLRELKRRRQQKQRDGRGSESDEQAEESDESEELESDVDEFRVGGEDEDVNKQVEWAADDEQEVEALMEATTSDLNHIRFSRKLLSRFCYYPEFASAVVGCFVRINVGFNERRQQTVYRICQVKKVVPAAKVYSFMNRVVDEALVVSHAGSERVVEMGMCSDGNFMPDEYEYWKTAMKNANLSLPTKRRVKEKFEAIRHMSHRALTTEEIDAMVERRRKLSGSVGATAVLEKALLQDQLEIATEQDNKEEQERLRAAIAKLEGKRSSHDASREREAKMSEMNKRNRRSNIQVIRCAEIEASRERRKHGNAMAVDPFSRLRTTAKIFHDAKVDEQIEVEAASSAPKSENINLSAIDDIIANLPIKLDIEI